MVDCERDLGWCGKGFCPRMLRRSCVSWYAVRDGKVARMRLGPSVEGLGRGWGLWVGPVVCVEAWRCCKPLYGRNVLHRSCFWCALLSCGPRDVGGARGCAPIGVGGRSCVGGGGWFGVWGLYVADCRQ